MKLKHHLYCSRRFPHHKVLQSPSSRLIIISNDAFSSFLTLLCMSHSHLKKHPYMHADGPISNTHVFKSTFK